MNVDLDESLVALIDEAVQCFSLNDTPENRLNLLGIFVVLGANSFATSLGEAQTFKQAFPELKLPVVEQEEPQPEVQDNPAEELKVDEQAPDRCPKCKKRVLWNSSKSMWTCNCRGYDVSPKAEAVCPHCNHAVVGEHYYWKCACNRYDNAPGVPAQWSSGFPVE